MGIDAGMKERVEETEKEWGAEDDGVLIGIDMSDGGDDRRMKDAINQGRNGKNKADERAGSAYVKKRACGANRGAHENERAESPDKRREGNKEGVACMDVMVAAGEEMPEFVGKENGQQSDGKGKTGQESGGIFVEESEGADEFVEGSGLIVGVGDGELGACCKASTERQ